MQPTPSRHVPGPEAGAVSRIGRPPSLSRAGRRAAPRKDEASDLLAADDPLAADQSRGEEDGAGDTLDEVARREREDMRPRLRDELGREPTEEELDEWLRRHTEGY